MIAQQIGTCCTGDKHLHVPSRYTVKGMSKYYAARPDKAIAAFYLTRGGAVVWFDGWREYRRWLPTYAEADQHYSEQFSGFCSQMNPSV